MNDALRRTASGFLSRYGMIIVLVLLAGFFSAATLDEQYPEGAAAARALAGEIGNLAAEDGTIVVVGRDNREDLEFVNALSQLLGDKAMVRAIAGDPAAVREGLQETLDDGETVSMLLATRSGEAMVRGVKERIAPLAGVPVRVPRGHRWPTFLLASNLLNVANQIAVIAIVAVGMTMVIVTSGIDLSVGSLIALSAVAAAWLIRRFGGPEAGVATMAAACLAAIALCAAVGAFSGSMITLFRLPPFIATLGMMQVAGGVAYIVSKGMPIHEIPDSFVWLGRGSAPVLSLPYAVILMLALYAIAHVAMAHTTFGRAVYAVGGNAEAARLSGIRVRRTLLVVYAVSGALAGVGGIVMASQLKSGAPTYGLMYELYVIAAVVVGGTSLSGGEGRIGGTLIGAFIIAVIWNGMNLTGVESYTQKVILGSVILVAVLVDQVKKSGWRGLLRQMGSGGA